MLNSHYGDIGKVLNGLSVSSAYAQMQLVAWCYSR